MSVSPYARDFGECSFPECDNRAAYKKLMLCPAHYLRHRSGNMGPLASRPERQFGCNFPYCDRPHKAKGWCEAHWDQVKRNVKQTPLRAVDAPPVNGGECSIDHCDRTAIASGLCSTHYQLRNTDRASCIIRVHAYSEDQKCLIDDCERTGKSFGLCTQHRARMRNFGLDLESYFEISSIKNCQICGLAGQMSIDHDHSCCNGNYSCGNCVRGVLCGNCNRGLGMFRDSESLLRSALNYLKFED